jgi:hypothetical protein
MGWAALFWISLMCGPVPFLTGAWRAGSRQRRSDGDTASLQIPASRYAPHLRRQCLLLGDAVHLGTYVITRVLRTPMTGQGAGRLNKAWACFLGATLLVDVFHAEGGITLRVSIGALGDVVGGLNRSRYVKPPTEFTITPPESDRTVATVREDSDAQIPRPMPVHSIVKLYFQCLL